MYMNNQDLFNQPRFHSFTQTKTNHKTGQIQRRQIYAQNQAMAKLQTDIKVWLGHLNINMPAAAGGLKNCSPKHYIETHRGNIHFYTTDLQHAYENVNLGKLADILVGLDNRHSNGYLYSILNKYCASQNNGLATGGTASILLFNIYCHFQLDLPLLRYCQKFGIVYNRYIDDMTFSHPTMTFGDKKRREILKIIRRAGFEINFAKTKVCDIRQGPVQICGCQLARNGRISLPKEKLLRIHGLLHLANHTNKFNRSQTNGLISYFLDIYGPKTLPATTHQTLLFMLDQQEFPLSLIERRIVEQIIDYRQNHPLRRRRRRRNCRTLSNR